MTKQPWEYDVDSEGPDLEDCTSEDADLDEIPCPSCGQMVYEEAEQCPHCREWVVRRWSSRGILGLVLIVIVIVTFLYAVLF